MIINMYINDHNKCIYVYIKCICRYMYDIQMFVISRWWYRTFLRMHTSQILAVCTSSMHNIIYMYSIYNILYIMY